MFCCGQWGHSGLQEAQEDFTQKEVVVLGKFAKNICFGNLLPFLRGFYRRGKRRKKKLTSWKFSNFCDAKP